MYEDYNPVIDQLKVELGDWRQRSEHFQSLLDQEVIKNSQLEKENGDLRQQIQHLQSCLDYEKEDNEELRAELDMEQRERNALWSSSSRI